MDTKALQVQNPKDKQLNYDDNEIKTLWVEDKLQRIDVARKLTAILSKVKTDKDGFTLVVKSPWGTGKTFFVEKWRDTLKKQGAFCVYFSAWEAEIQKSPAAYFLQAFIEEFEANSELHSKLDFALAKGTIQVLPIFFTLLTIAYIPVGAAYALLVKLFGDTIAKTCSAALKKLEKKQSIEEAVLPVREAKKHLAELMQIVAESSFDGKVYVFIDELDRCKPDFAIKVLEEIKHFFCLPNLVFVLTVDFDQLEGSIKHVYGKHIDCEGYLMRFVNLFYTLPPILHEQFAEFLFKQLNDRKSKHSCLSLSIEGQNTFANIFAGISKAFKASLRDQLLIIQKLELILSAGKVFLLPTVYLLFVQMKFPALWQIYYSKGKINELSPSRIDYAIESFENERWRTLPREKSTYSSKQSLYEELRDQKYYGLINNSIDLLTAESRQEEYNKRDKELLENGLSYELNYWRLVIAENWKDFFNQLDLINLYSEGFG